MNKEKPVISAHVGMAVQAAALAAQTIAVSGNLPPKASPWVMFGAAIVQAFVGSLSGGAVSKKQPEAE